jgi:hypothetical protein
MYGSYKKAGKYKRYFYGIQSRVYGGLYFNSRPDEVIL